MLFKKIRKSPDYNIRTFFIIGGFNVKFCFLTDEFFDLYKECEEIEKKNNRPYQQFVF